MGALLVSNNCNKTLEICRKNRYDRDESFTAGGHTVPAELEEGSWLVEGRLALSEGWLDSSKSS